MSAIEEEIKNPKYRGLTDDEIAEQLNTADQACLRPLASIEVLAWAAGDRLAKIKKAASGAVPFTTLPDAVRGAAMAAEYLIERPDARLDMSSNRVVEMFNGLIAGGILTEADLSDIMHMAESKTSKAIQLTGGNVTNQQVHIARGGL